MVSRSVLASLILLTAYTCPVNGHDIRGLGDNSQKISDLVSTARLLELAGTQVDPEARSVYARLLLWKAGDTLAACFFDGTQDEKAFVVRTTEELISLSKVNLKVDFGTAPAYQACSALSRRGDMRFGFSNGCCSAYVGRNAHYPHPTVLNGPSIKLQGILNKDPAHARQVVMHEVMHAWGFEHEHQAPDSPCVFNKSVIQNRTGWDDDDYRTNLQRLDRDSRTYKWTSYDGESVMKYFFSEDELVGGKSSPCFSDDNLSPSARDIKGLQDAYPATPLPISPDRARSLVGGIASSSAPQPIKDLARALRQLDERN